MVGDGGLRVGRVEGEEIHPLGGSSMLEYIEHGRDADRQPGGEAVQLSEARLRAPVTRPGKIIGIGLNYEDHARETGAEAPEKPIVFAKYPNTVAGQGDAIRIPPITEQVDYEADSPSSSDARRATSPKTRPWTTSSDTPTATTSPAATCSSPRAGSGRAASP
jgi:hypothetical protein